MRAEVEGREFEKGGIVGAVSDLLIRQRKIAFALGLLLFLLGAIGLPRVHVDNDYRAFFNDDQQYLEMSDWLNARLGYERDLATLVYQPADGTVFSALSIMQVDEILLRAQELPHVVHAEAWIDQEKMVLTDEDVAVAQPFLTGLNIFEEADRAILKADALATPAVAGRYISSAGDSAAIVLLLDTDSVDPQRLSKLDELYAAIRILEQELGTISPGDSVQLVGAALFDYQAQHVLRTDVRVLMPIALGLIFVVIWLLFHSLRFAMLSLLMIGLPVIATAGLLATFGVSFSALAVSGLLLVGTLAVADILHVSSTYFMAKAEGLSAEGAMGRALKLNIWAIFATSLTTALGQIALLASASPPIRVMGLTVIVGVWLALLIALLMLPFTLMALKGVRSPRLLKLSEIMGGVGLWGARHSVLVLALSIGFFSAATLSLSQSHLTDSLGGWFSKDTEFRRGMDAISDGYVGADSLTIAVEATVDDFVDAGRYPEDGYISGLYTGFQDALDARSGEGVWFTPVTTVRATQGRLAEADDTTFRKIGAGQVAAPKFSGDNLSASGLLTPLSLGSKDYSLWKFDPVSTSSFELLSGAEAFEQVASETFDEREVRIGGLSLAFANLSVENFRSIVTSSLFAFVLISLTMFFVLASLKLGIAALLPNLVPIIVTLGIWAALVGEINLAVATVFSVSMGLVVDDTVHILSKYKFYRSTGTDVGTSIENAIRSSGPGIATTTLVISCGFFLLGTSDFLLTAQKALLVGATMVSALIFDIIALPAMIVLVERFGAKGGVES